MEHETAASKDAALPSRNLWHRFQSPEFLAAIPFSVIAVHLVFPRRNRPRVTVRHALQVVRAFSYSGPNTVRSDVYRAIATVRTAGHLVLRNGVGAFR